MMLLLFARAEQLAKMFYLMYERFMYNLVCGLQYMQWDGHSCNKVSSAPLQFHSQKVLVSKISGVIWSSSGR